MSRSIGLGFSIDKSAVQGATGEAGKRLQTAEGRTTRAIELRAYANYYESNGDKPEANKYRKQADELDGGK